jgi:hypothetical protein
MSQAFYRRRALLLLACLSVLLGAAPALAQERWTPDLIICGIDTSATPDPGAWIWPQSAATTSCDSNHPPFVLDTGGPDILKHDRLAPYLNQPNDFVEVIKPAVGNNPPIRHLLIADALNGRVLRFVENDSSLAYVGELAPNTFGRPAGIVGDADGNIIVTDQESKYIRRFDFDGNLIGDPLPQCANDQDNGEFLHPWRVALTPGARITPGSESGQVMIIDGGKNRVTICTAQMNFVAHFGNLLEIPGSSPGYFSTPTGITADATGHIYVADPNNGRVQIFDATQPLDLGSLPVWILSNSTEPVNHTTVPDMQYPFGLAVDANGRLLVADSDSNAMWVFDTFANQLKPLNVIIGSAAPIPGESDPLVFPPGGPGQLQGPSNISLDSTGRLLIADTFNFRVQRFSHPAMTVTVTPPTEAVGPTTPLVLIVAVQAASGTFTSVTPIATLIPPSDPADLGTLTITSDSTTVTAGNGPTIFTMTYSGHGAGNVAFSVYATGIDQDGKSVTALDGAGLTEAFAIGGSGHYPTTVATVSGTPADVNGVTWYVTPPTVHLAASGDPTPAEIHFKIAPNSQYVPEVNTTDFTTCPGTSCDVPQITADGPTIIWFRAVSVSAEGGRLPEPWQFIRVYYDKSPPEIDSYTITPTQKNGWSNSDFDISYHIAVGLVGLPDDVQNPGVIHVTTATQPDSTTVIRSTPSIADAAGRIGAPYALGPFKLDATPPTVTCTPVSSYGPNGAGWFRGSVSATFTATDNLSGIDGQTSVSPTQALTADGMGQQLSIGPNSFFDMAGNGNVTPAICSGINIDTTAPLVTGVTTFAPAGTGWFNATTTRPVVHFTAVDPGAQASGLTAASQAAQNVTVGVDGIQTISPTTPFFDVAGNSAAALTVATGAVIVKVDTVVPTLTNLTITGPGGLLPVNGIYNLTGMLPSVGVTVAVTSTDVTSGVQQVCYDLSGGSVCTPATASGSTFSLTVLNTVTNAKIWSVDVAGNASPAQTFSIKITRSAPVANDLNFTTPVNTTSSGTVTSTGGTGTITYALVSGSGPMVGASVVVNANGTFTYTPKTNYFGADSFKFSATDANGSGSQGTVHVTVGSGTAPPVASGGSFTTNEDTQSTIPATTGATPLVTDADTPAGSLTLAIVQAPAHGSAAVSGGSLVYTPAADYFGADTFTYRASDPEGNVSSVAAISMTVNAVNDAPSFTPGAATVTANEDASAQSIAWATGLNKGAANESAQVLNFLVSNNNSALFAAAGQPAISATGTLTFTPAANAYGSATVIVKLHDDGGTANGGVDTSAAATFTITINPVNDPPTFALAGTSVTVLQNSGAQTLANWATNISAGPNETQTVSFIVTSSSAIFSVQPAISAAGTLTFTPLANATGTATITVKAQDNGGTANGGGDTSAAQTFTITVKALNQNPVCTAASASPGSLWPPNHKFVAIAINGVTDPDHDALMIAVTKIWQDESTMADGSGDTPIDGAIVNGAAQVRAERSGQGDGRIYQIFFTATDAKGGSCSGSVNVGVPHDQSGGPVVDSGVRYDSLVANGPVVAGTPPNRVPVAKADSASTLKSVAVTVAVLANDSDPDGNTLTVTAVTTPAHGTAVIQSNGTVKYTPTSGYGGTDSFTYTVSDGHGGTATGTVTITIGNHTDGDGCDRDRSRGWHDEDNCDHDRDTDRRHDSRWHR